MGGKKKGGLANRLARMTDDERSKYLQRKADMEEEARRRKEQLVANFMKNKLKREDVFSRLNMAKINQQWHHIMRADKCKNMKQEVEHLRKWIDRTVKLKNRTITKLMEELDWQEELYGKNFKAHSEHIDKIIEFHTGNLDELHNQYADDRILLLHIGSTERKDFEGRTGNEIENLKTIIYGQSIKAEKSQKENRENYMKHIDEMLSTYRTDLSQMRKSREKISCALWRQISKVLKAYVHQTDIKRSHLAELKRLDIEGATAVAKNQQQIMHEGEQIEKLKHEYSTLVKTREMQIKTLEGQVKAHSARFLQMKKTLNYELAVDERQLTLLTDISNNVIKDLETLAKQGEQILQIDATCKKLETEDERINKWSAVMDETDMDKFEEKNTTSGDVSIIENISKVAEEDIEGSFYVRKFSWEAFDKALDEGTEESESSSAGKSDSSKEDIDDTAIFPTLAFESSTEIITHELNVQDMMIQGSKSNIQATTKIRPKTSIVRKLTSTKQTLRKLRSEEIFKKSQETPVFHISTSVVKATTSQEKLINYNKKSLSIRPTKSALISQKRISASASRKFPVAALQKPSHSKAIPEQMLLSHSPSTPLEPLSECESPKTTENGFEDLSKLEGLWWIYNKVEMECIKLRDEKKRLLQEKNKLKEITRGVLAAAALGQSIPSAKSSSTTASRKRFILSAPLSSYSVF